LTTQDVKDRLKAALIPSRTNFLEIIENNVDFYIPFWTAITLILGLVASANVSLYLDV